MRALAGLGPRIQCLCLRNTACKSCFSSLGLAPACEVQADGCYCPNATVATSAVFTDASSVPTAAEVEGALAIGAPRPSDYAGQLYALCTTAYTTETAVSGGEVPKPLPPPSRAWGHGPQVEYVFMAMD